ncbi:MAG: phosphomannose isomerase type II C-terminal cupin domain [Rhizobacter sp.]|nr:phosphomannose isomerase type II C-terminal cupin domain [Chlorobiales bacterium]
MIDSDNRPWGRWEEYLNETGYRVKRIVVNVGQRISLQKHAQRAEHWVIVAGHGKFTLNDEVKPIHTGDAVMIPIGGIHRVENDGTEDLIIIETQLGVCIEEDIVRLQDDWNRK